MGCPTCKKLGLPPAYFCTQECFQQNWSSHKKTHKQVTAQERTNKCLDRSVFQHYKFTGPLRPSPVTYPQRPVPAINDLPDYAVSGTPEAERVAARSGVIPSVDLDSLSEMEKLRGSCALGRATLDVAGSMIAPGVTGEQIDTAVHEFIVSHNAYPSPLNYRNFPRSVCVSVNEVVCHGIPDSRPLEVGDIVNVDVTCYFKGYHADLNETFIVGEVEDMDDDSLRLLRGAYECLMEAIKICRPGTM